MSAIHYGIPWKQVLSGGFTDAIVRDSDSEIPRRLETNERLHIEIPTRWELVWNCIELNGEQCPIECYCR